MHPAFSVIFFTVFSGTGYGLLALMGMSAALGLLPRNPWLIGVGLIVMIVGLIGFIKARWGKFAFSG